jgi:hypothetical protein
MPTPAPHFVADIKPLFRERDRRAMTFLFDLWDYRRPGHGRHRRLTQAAERSWSGRRRRLVFCSAGGT